MFSSRAELLAWIAARPPLQTLVAKVQGSDDAAHDFAHLLRVALWTLRLGGASVVPEEAVAAALLHDLVNLPKNHPNRAQASELSAKAALHLLTAAGFGDQACARITAAIRDHSYSRGAKPSEALGQALQDADRLEALGAIGIMRVFSTGMRMGAHYFHPADPWAKDREHDDKTYSVDHFFTKLLLLPDLMNTEAGRAEAQRRAEVLRSFLHELGTEIGEPA